MGVSAGHDDLHGALLAFERDVDGALYFDGDGDAAMATGQRLVRRLKNNRDGLDEAARARVVMLLGRILNGVQGDKSGMFESDILFACGDGPCLRRIDVARIALACKGAGRIRDGIARWIGDDGDLAVTGLLLSSGDTHWQAFALYHVQRALAHYGQGYATTQAWPENWPARVMHLAADVTGDPSVCEKAAAVVDGVKKLRRQRVRAAIRAAVRPFSI